MPISGPPLRETTPLDDLLRGGLTAQAGEMCLILREKRWSWRELHEASERLAANLMGLGLAPGDRVASLMPNCDALLVHYLACFRAGLVATPLNYRYMAPEIDHALDVSEASILLAHAERDADLATAKQVSKLPLGVIGYATGDIGSPTYEQLLARDTANTALPRLESTAPAAIFFTSGSTGPAKGVTHSRASLSAIFASAAQAFELTADDVVLPASSLSHLGAFIYTLAALSAGAPVVIPRSFDPDELLPLLREEHPTVLCMSPAYLFRLVRDHGATHEDFASLRVCRSGGDKVSAALEREFHELAGFPIDESYGMTEVGVATINPPSGLIKIGSIGSPNPGYEMSIRNEEGGEVPPGAEGRLWIKSPANMAGYWKNPQATDEVTRDGWLDSGDLMMADEDGYLWFRGRKKQIIVHDSSNICPQEVEEALLEHPAVESAGVVGVHDLIHGENVRAYVTLNDEVTRPTAQSLIQFTRQQVGYKAPEEIEFLAQMPLNATGKVDRVRLKQLAAHDDHTCLVQ